MKEESTNSNGQRENLGGLAARERNHRQATGPILEGEMVSGTILLSRKKR
jgi:hypothetical protein